MPCQLSAFFSLPLEKYLAVEHLRFPYENEAASPSETASQIWRISSCPAPSRAPCGTVKSLFRIVCRHGPIRGGQPNCLECCKWTHPKQIDLAHLTASGTTQK